MAEQIVWKRKSFSLQERKKKNDVGEDKKIPRMISRGHKKRVT